MTYPVRLSDVLSVLSSALAIWLLCHRALVMVGGNMLRRVRNCLSYYYYYSKALASASA